MTLRGTPHLISHVTELEQCWWHGGKARHHKGCPPERTLALLPPPAQSLPASWG